MTVALHSALESRGLLRFEVCPNGGDGCGCPRRQTPDGDTDELQAAHPVYEFTAAPEGGMSAAEWARQCATEALRLHAPPPEPEALGHLAGMTLED